MTSLVVLLFLNDHTNSSGEPGLLSVVNIWWPGTLLGFWYCGCWVLIEFFHVPNKFFSYSTQKKISSILQVICNKAPVQKFKVVIRVMGKLSCAWPSSQFWNQTKSMLLNMLNIDNIVNDLSFLALADSKH